MKKIFVILALAVFTFACADDDYVADIKVDSSELYFLNEGGTKTLDIASNTSWSVTSDQSWVKVSESQGVNSNSLLIEVEPNSAGGERNAVITIKNIFGQEVKKAIKVIQGNTGASATQLSYSYQASTQGFTVNIDGNWTLEKTGDWFVLSAESGKGNTIVDVTVKPNNGEGTRSGKIVLKGEGVNDIEINVQQAKLPELVGLYILSEGNWNSSQSDLAYYDYTTGTTTKKFYKAQNGATLGDLGNDLAIYGGKMYCIVSGASVAAGGGRIEIIDIETGKSQEKIPFKDALGGADMPRKMAFYKDKVYITGYSGIIARLDTASLAIDGIVSLSGTYTEGIAQYGGKLYACNSGYGSGNTISVVDIASFKETKVISVPQNPYAIKASSTGNIYFNTADLSWSTGAPANLHLLDAKTETVTKTFDIETVDFAVNDSYIYSVFNYTDWSTFETIDYSYKINQSSNEVAEFTTQIPSYFMVYKVNVNPYNGDVYMGGQGNDVAVFGADGSLKTKISSGTGYTSTIVPVYR
ncbi:hypothetical protein GGR21_001634 [Dysgonomonas hofstadii]|uniref:BACON domain-containing protein n=1 Tax=Dysgonomonas hofstadii TaxID=637886 RepID=A0A840CM33_9BACT|nr:BACON domain-containing carbohydrate-binding protein [Dysgonomonas hofstadii]MBB4035739.1 hypothetical protein [Dysgonomonas hofstadii]